MTTERRFFHTKVEVRADGDNGCLYGRAAAYNKISHDLGGFREKLLPGAFATALQHASIADCYMCYEHNPKQLLGKVRAGNLQLTDKPDGLYFNCQLPDTQLARDLRSLVSKGILSECSFAFSVPDDGDLWQDEDLDPDDLPDRADFSSRSVRCKVRTVRSVLPLFDVSVVNSPAYGDGATVANARNYFPQGIPVSVRSHVKDVAAILSYQRQARRGLINRIIGQ